MPTPDDVVSPVEHERATCPPEDARISNAHDLNDTRDGSASNHVEPARRRPMQQQPTPPPHGTREQSPSETHSKPSSASIEAPNRDTPTPMTATDDGAEDQRASQASPLSANAPAPIRYTPSHLAAPFPGHRVCLPIRLEGQSVYETLFADKRRSSSPIHPPRFSALAAASKAVKPPTASSMRWTLKSNMLTCASHSCVDICAYKVGDLLHCGPVRGDVVLIHARFDRRPSQSDHIFRRRDHWQ